MVFGVLSGAFLRAMPHHHDHDHCDSHGWHHHGHDLSSDGHSKDAPHEDDHGPDESGHFHLCCFAAPMMIDEAFVDRLPRTHGQLQRVCADGVLLPDGPVFELELPPLI